ncbi:MAG: flippase-like domain-containing protein [bacterium]|nr:flippase-like domain-containing protein [bacterium]
MKKKFLLGLAISAFCLYLVFRNIDFAALRRSLAEVRYLYLLLALIFVFLFTFFRALRWQYLLNPVKRIKTTDLFEITTIGYLANNILPARIGEVVRALVLSKTEGIKAASSLATIITERFFDVITLLLILALGSRHLPLPRAKGYIIFLAGGSFGLICVFMLLIRYKKERLFQMIHNVFKPISGKVADRVQQSIQGFGQGLEALRCGGNLLVVSALSVMIGLSMGAIYFFAALGFGITLSLSRLILLISMIFLGVTIPSSPGFIGTFHYFCIKGLLLGGVKDKHLALSYAIVIHLIQYIPESLAGLFFLWKKGISLGEIHTAEVPIEAVQE